MASTSFCPRMVWTSRVRAGEQTLPASPQESWLGQRIMTLPAGIACPLESCCPMASWEKGRGRGAVVYAMEEAEVGCLSLPSVCPVEKGAVLTLGLYWSILLLAISPLRHSFSPAAPPELLLHTQRSPRGPNLRHLPLHIFPPCSYKLSPGRPLFLLGGSNSPQNAAVSGSPPVSLCARLHLPYLVCKAWYSPWLRSRCFSLTFPFLLHNN